MLAASLKVLPQWSRYHRLTHTTVVRFTTSEHFSGPLLPLFHPFLLEVMAQSVIEAHGFGAVDFAESLK